MHTLEAGTLSTSFAVGTSVADEMLHTHVTNTIVLPDEALVIENEADRSTVSVLKGLGINMVVLRWGTLYVLQDGVIVELQAKEGHVLQVLCEQRINIEQLSLQRDEVVA